MNPVVSKKPYTDDNGIYHFTLSKINVSFANALRRVMISDIPTIVFNTEIYEDNKCTILKNTGRLHNEIVKHRLSCIPIHSEDDELIEKYIMELHMKNETDAMMIVTTEHFRIKNKETGAYLKDESVRKIFPPDSITGDYIDFVRLRPHIGDTIDGEEIHLTCEFSKSVCHVNSTFNVVSTCAYSNTIDTDRAEKALVELKQKWATSMSTDEVAFQEKNFRILDMQRYYLDESYDYHIKSVGVYKESAIVRKAAIHLHNMFVEFVQAVDSDLVPITMSETTVPNSYDVGLVGIDYTIGCILEYMMYETHYLGDKVLSFCGFRKVHPHNDDSVLRIAYNERTDKTAVRQHLKAAAISASEVFKKLTEMFRGD